ncbi:MAG: type II secretion system protein [Pyrinomonadaceae bacterium]
MRKDRGFSLIELLIVVAMIGVIAAIAVPNLMSARRSANEAATISALRTVHGAQAVYATTFGDGDYAGTPAGLDGVALTQLGAVYLVDEVLASGTRSGYVFTSGTTAATASLSATFCTRAIPTINSGATQTGSRCFGVATNAVIMSNTASDIANCGCSIGADGGAFVDRSNPLGE